MNDNVWYALQSFYEQNFGIPARVVDYIAVRPILLKSVSGYSNRRITKYNDEGLDYIEDILYDFLDFFGWKDDMDVNFIAIYNRCNGNKDCFRQEIYMCSYNMKDETIDLAFDVCKKYDYIVKEIDKYYGKNSPT